MPRPGGYFKTPPKPKRKKPRTIKVATERIKPTKAVVRAKPKAPQLVPFTMLDKAPKKVTTKQTVTKGGQKFTRTVTRYKPDKGFGPVDIRTFKPKFRHTYIHKPTGLPLRVEQEGTSKQSVKIMAAHVDTPDGRIYYKRAVAQPGRGDVATKNYKLKMFRGPDIPVTGQGHLSKKGTLSLRGSNVKIGKLPNIDYTSGVSYPGEVARVIGKGIKLLNQPTTYSPPGYRQGNTELLKKGVKALGNMRVGGTGGQGKTYASGPGAGIKLKDVIRPVTHGIKTGGEAAFKAALIPQHKLYKLAGVKSGADIAEKIGLEKQFGLGFDIATDPLMWASIVAAPETGGASAARLIARLEAAGDEGRYLLASKAIRDAAKKTRATRDVSHLEKAIKQGLDANPELAAKVKAVSRKQVRQTERLLRAKPTKDIIGSLRMGVEDAPVIPKRAGLERLKRKAVKGKGKTLVFVPGLEGPEAVHAAARSVANTGLIKPGLRLQMISPAGSRRLFGKDLPGITVPLPKFAKVPGLKGTRLAAFSLEKQQALGKIAAKYDQPIRDLDELEKQVRRDPNIARERMEELTADIQKQKAFFAKSMDAEIHRITRELNRRGPRHMLDLETRSQVINARKLARTINPAADEFGRMVSNRYMRLVHDAVSVLPKNPVQKQNSLERIDLLMRAMYESAGGEAALERAGFKFTEAERTVANSLRVIYDDYLRHGQELGVFGPGLQSGHYVPRVWMNTNRKQSLKTEDVVNHIVDNLTGGVGSHSSFLHQRVHPETFTLHGRESLKDSISRLSDNPNLDEDALDAAADLLHQRGQMKLAANLLVRGLQRGQVFKLGEDPIVDRAYDYLTRMAPQRGQASVPLVTNEDGIIRFANNDIERYYGIRPDLFDTRTGASLTEDARKGVNFQLAAEDLSNVRQILDDVESKHLDPEYHAFLEDQNIRLTAEANEHLGQNWGIRTQDKGAQPRTSLTSDQLREVYDAIETIDPRYRSAPVVVHSMAEARQMGMANVFGWWTELDNTVHIVYMTPEERRQLWDSYVKDQDLPPGYEDILRQGRSEGPQEPPPGHDDFQIPPDELPPVTRGLEGDYWDELTQIEQDAPSDVAAIANRLFNQEQIDGHEAARFQRYLRDELNPIHYMNATHNYQGLRDEIDNIVRDLEGGGDTHAMIDMSRIPARGTAAKGEVPETPVVDFFGTEMRSILQEKKQQQLGYGGGPLSRKAAEEGIDPATGKPFGKIPKWGQAEVADEGSRSRYNTAETYHGMTYDEWLQHRTYRSTLIHEYAHSINLKGPSGTIRDATRASKNYISSKALEGLTFDPATGSGLINLDHMARDHAKIEREAKKLWIEHLPGGEFTGDALLQAANVVSRYTGPDNKFVAFASTIHDLLHAQHTGYGETLAQVGETAGGMLEIIPRFAQMMAVNEAEFVKLVGNANATVIKEAVLTMQSGVKLDRRTPEIQLNEDGIAWIMDPKGQPPNGRPPHFHGADAFDDPFEYSQQLPDLRDENMEIILDPRRTNYYRTRSQGVVTATVARVQTIDRDLGRSSREANNSVILPNGTTVPASRLRLGGQTSDDQTRFFIDTVDHQVYAEGDLHFPERSLIPNSDNSVYYDPQSHKEYVHPSIPNQEGQPSRVMTVGADRLWPTETVDAFRMELAQAGRYDRLFYTGMDGLGGKVLANIRYGVTTPFPAYHIRNMVSDILKSLQADSGVLFHPITNAKLAAAAFGKRTGYIKIPGHGKIPLEDFLFMADTFGLNSGHHVAEIYRLMEAGQWNETTGRRILQELSVLGPNSRFGQAAIHFGNSRENVMRFITFMQRLRRNDGDAADAALYMIRHHFNYNDITRTEKRVMRNVFLFYTWYRKNIPLQLIELGRRPGFFAGIAHTYADFAAGETPLNQDYSRIAPWLPDLTGALPKQNLIPEYFANQLGALEGNWNGHALAIGFGAPWADLSILRLNQEGFNQTLSMMNPAITTAYSIGTRRDTLTGRDLMKYEPSGTANLVDQIERIAGAKLPRDKNGNPVLPYWVDRVLRNIPITGRAFGSIGAPTDPKRDPGRAQTLTKELAPIFGLNMFIGPEVGGKRQKLQMQKAAAAYAAKLNDFKQRTFNLPADIRKKQANEMRKELEADWKAKGLPLRILYNAHGWPKPEWAQKKRGRKKKIGNYGGRVYFPGGGTTKFPGSGGF